MPLGRAYSPPFYRCGRYPWRCHGLACCRAVGPEERQVIFRDCGSIPVDSTSRSGRLNIEHRTSNIEHRTSNIEHRTSNIEHRTSNVEPKRREEAKTKRRAIWSFSSLFDVQRSMFNVLRRPFWRPFRPHAFLTSAPWPQGIATLSPGLWSPGPSGRCLRQKRTDARRGVSRLCSTFNVQRSTSDVRCSTFPCEPPRLISVSLFSSPRASARRRCLWRAAGRRSGVRRRRWVSFGEHRGWPGGHLGD